MELSPKIDMPCVQIFPVISCNYGVKEPPNVGWATVDIPRNAGTVPRIFSAIQMDDRMIS